MLEIWEILYRVEFAKEYIIRNLIIFFNSFCGDLESFTEHWLSAYARFFIKYNMKRAARCVVKTREAHLLKIIVLNAHLYRN